MTKTSTPRHKEYNDARLVREGKKLRLGPCVCGAVLEAPARVIPTDSVNLVVCDLCYERMKP